MIVVRIAENPSARAPDVSRDRFANRHIPYSREKRAFDAVIPTDYVARIVDPGLVNKKHRFAREERRNEMAQGDVVLENERRTNAIVREAGEGWLTQDGNDSFRRVHSHSRW